MKMVWLPRFQRKSIYSRLFTTYLLLTTLATTLMAGYILWSFYAYFIRTRETDLDNWTTALGESVADALEEDNIERVKILIQRHGAPDTVTLRVFAKDGRLLATSSPTTDLQVTNWQTVPGMVEAFAGNSAKGTAKGIMSADDRLFIARPILRNGEFLGVLRMSVTLQQLQRQFARIIATIVGALLLTIFLCALLSDLLARSLAKPIEIMGKFAVRLGNGHFSDRLNIHQNNELDQLATELNRMGARLASLDQERRAFLANASHELRTPISNVQVTVEALRNGAADDVVLRDRFLEIIEGETKRLAYLIRDLLDLGRLEAGVSALEKQSLSLQHLLNRALGAMELRLQGRGLLVHKKLIDLQIQGDPERLLQALLNILDNAVKHSREGSVIFVYTYRSGKEAIIQIRDEGPGIKEKDLPHIFEQFYTTDASRKGAGTGLGLAIAKRIIEAHSGGVTATSVPGQGATFNIHLPL